MNQITQILPKVDSCEGCNFHPLYHDIFTRSFEEQHSVIVYVHQLNLFIIIFGCRLIIFSRSRNNSQLL